MDARRIETIYFDTLAKQCMDLLDNNFDVKRKSDLLLDDIDTMDDSTSKLPFSVRYYCANEKLFADFIEHYADYQKKETNKNKEEAISIVKFIAYYFFSAFIYSSVWSKMLTTQKEIMKTECKIPYNESEELTDEEKELLRKKYDYQIEKFIKNRFACMHAYNIARNTFACKFKNASKEEIAKFNTFRFYLKEIAVQSPRLYVEKRKSDSAIPQRISTTAITPQRKKSNTFSFSPIFAKSTRSFSKTILPSKPNKPPGP